jgi:hypothetical protein
MRLRAIYLSALAATVLGGSTLTFTPANAQFWNMRAYRHHRDNHRNEWRNIAIGAGALGLIGALEHDDTLFFAGTAGALYSAYRYDQDRRSYDRTDRLRARYFSKPYFERDGVRYNRRTEWRDGAKYYRFEREY